MALGVEVFFLSGLGDSFGLLTRGVVAAVGGQVSCGEEEFAGCSEVGGLGYLTDNVGLFVSGDIVKSTVGRNLIARSCLLYQ